MGKNVIQIILKGVDKSSAAFKSADKSASGFKKALKGVAAGAGVAAVAVGAFALSAVKLAARVETLAVVTKVLGESAGYTEKQIRGVEESIAAQGITVRAARQSVAKMIQSNIDLAKATDLATMAQNAAVIAGTDSSEAFNRLVNTIQTANVRMGRTMGLALNFGKAYEDAAAKVGRTAESLTEAERAIARTNHVLDQGETIAGAYGAAMETAGKQITSFPRYIEEIKVSVGDILLPVWTRLVFGTKEWVTGLRDIIEAKKELKGKMDNLVIAGLNEEEILKRLIESGMGYQEATENVKEEKGRLIRVMETETNRWQGLADSILEVPDLVPITIETDPAIETMKKDFLDFDDVIRNIQRTVHIQIVTEQRAREAAGAAAEQAGVDVGGFVPQYATGGRMIVPPGYPNDSYRVGVSSGEEVIVKTPAQQKAGDNNSRSFVVNNYISTDIEQQSYEDMFKRMATRN